MIHYQNQTRRSNWDEYIYWHDTSYMYSSWFIIILFAISLQVLKTYVTAFLHLELHEATYGYVNEKCFWKTYYVERKTDGQLKKESKTLKNILFEQSINPASSRYLSPTPWIRTIVETKNIKMKGQFDSLKDDI